MASSRKAFPADLPLVVETFLRKSVSPGQTLLLGFSGGLDSRVLLDLLVSLREIMGYQLRALHVHHGLSPHADAWASFCKEVCVTQQVPFQAIKAQVPRDSGLGLEAAARLARYEALLAQPAAAILLAHHRDDQAETLLLQLLRGAGAQGLSAMAAEHGPRCADRRLLRPLLTVGREALQRYAEARGLRWIEDESNRDIAHDRNFLRHQIVPQLQQRFPAALTTLARSAAHLAEAAELLREVGAEDAVRWVRDGRLQLAGLAAMSPPRACNLLRYWLQGYGVSLPTRRIAEVLRQLTTARADAAVRIAVPNGTLQRYRGEAYFCAGAPPRHFEARRWQGESEMAFPGGRLLLAMRHGQGMQWQQVEAKGLWLRPRQGGERMRPEANRPTRPLRLLFQEAGVPPWQRDSLPMAYVGAQLAAVPGIGVDCDFQAAPDAPGLVMIWQPD